MRARSQGSSGCEKGPALLRAIAGGGEKMSAINTPRLSFKKNAPTKTENEKAGGDKWEEENGSSGSLPCYQPAHPGLVSGLSSPLLSSFSFY